ncbi:MAG: TonB-dependent receptor [Pelobacteraceae bacterium]
MLFTRLILAALLIFIPIVTATANAADPLLSLRGTVYEKGTRRPLDGVTIFVTGKEALTVITEPDGSFTLEVPAPGDYELAAAAVGFVKPAPVSATAGNARVAIYLEPVYAMNEVVILAERNPDRIAKTVISGKELASVPGSAGDPLRAIQALPGITSSGDTSSAPAIRGSGPRDNAYYVDFLPVGYLFHMGGMESVINADLVEDFNIYSSSFGPEYADVTGGIIDVRLRKPRTDRLGAKLNISMLESDVLVEGPITKNQSFYLAGRRSYFDLIMPKTGTMDTGVEYKQFPQYYDYQGKYIWQISPDSSLTLMVNGAGDEMKLNLTNDANAVKHDPILAGDIQSRVGYHSQGALLNSRIIPALTNRFSMAHTFTDVQQQLAQLGYVKINGDDFHFRDHLTMQATEKHELLFGVESGISTTKLDLDITKEMPSEFKPGPPIHSLSPRVKLQDTISAQWVDLALKDRWQFLDKATLVIGVHGSYETYFEKYRLEPRLGLEYTPLKDTLLSAGWGKYHQFPQGYQVVMDFGNPGLSYEEADHYSLGVEQQLQDAWSVKLEGYYKRLANLVIPHDPENYINGGSGKAYGIEALVKKNKTAGWSGWLSASYTKTERHNDVTGAAFPYSYDQPLIVNLVYEWNFAKNWTFGTKWRYQSGAPFTPVIGTSTKKDTNGNPILVPTYGAIGSERLPDYHRLDVRIAREFLFDKWKLSAYLDIINAYARQNVSGYDYNGDYTSRKNISQLPLIPALGIRGEF